MSGRLNKVNEFKETTSVFYGINKGERIPDGYFSDSLNMSSDEFPCAVTRNERKKIEYSAPLVFPGEPVAAAVIDDSAVIACSNGFVCTEDKIIDTRGEITDIIPFGKRIYCVPSGVLFEPDSDAVFFSQFLYSEVCKVNFCTSSAESISVSAGKKPTDPTDGQYWYDSANKGLYRYSMLHNDWTAQAHMYICLTFETKPVFSLKAGDALRLTFSGTEYDTFVEAVYEKSVVLDGVFEPDIISEQSSVFIERKTPSLDYATAHNNRIWGCFYDGNSNEIYASKLGDPLNWYCYRGLSTDSYAVSCGESGDFTGCTELGDSVIFFKENCIYTVYGSEPSNFQTVKTACFGVQKGSEKSIVRINGSVYYKSAHGIMKLSEGSLPVCVSNELGSDIWRNAIGGTDGRKYYITMEDINGFESMYVYDTVFETWQKESIPCKDCFGFLTYKNNLLAVGKTATEQEAYVIKKEGKNTVAPKREDYATPIAYSLAVLQYLQTNILAFGALNSTFEEIKKMLAENKGKNVDEISITEVNDYLSDILKTEETFYYNMSFLYLSNEVTCNAYLPLMDGKYEQADEGRFMWGCETGLRGLSLSDYKRLKGIDIKMKLSPGARCDIYIEYDGNGKWENIGSTDEDGIKTLRIKDRLSKCEVYRLRLRGYGQAVIYSILETYEEAGNIGF